jgi:hypothetical protein
MERYERKNKGNPQRTARSRSNRSPQLEEKVIGGNVDLDLLSLFPQKDARIMGGKEEGEKAFKVNRETQFVLSPRRKKGYLYPPIKYVTVGVTNTG